MRPLDHWDLQTNLQSNYAALDGMRHHKSEWSKENWRTRAHNLLLRGTHYHENQTSRPAPPLAS
jgi:hypothetical protein